MGYKIGSFNLRNLGLSSMGDKNARDFNKIAQIIQNEQFDVVALQEVLSEGKAFVSENYAKKSILMELGNDWGFEWANAEDPLDNRGEGYAFVWNTKRLRLATAELMDHSFRTFYPRICKINKEYLRRKPYYARFTPEGTLVGGPSIELRLLCIHTYYGSDSSLDRLVRDKELEVLMTDVYPQIADKVYKNDMVHYTLLMGDYNVELWRSGKEAKRKIENNMRRGQGKSTIAKPAFLKADANDIVESVRWGNRKIKTVQDELTTLKSSEQREHDNGYAHDYDHFSFEESQFEGVQMKAYRIDAVKKYCNSDFKQYLETVSDHIPIMMEIELN